MSFLLPILVGILGSWLFYKMKVPVGALIGAIIFSSCFHIFTGIGDSPAELKTAVQAVAGAFIGQRVTRSDLLEMRKMISAAILMFVITVIYTLTVGKLLSCVSILDYVTALTCAMPGGLSDIAIISSDLGADPAQSVMIQTVRSVFSILVLPQLAFHICSHWSADQRKKTCDMTNSPASTRRSSQEKQGEKSFIKTIVITASSGFLGKAIGIPAGALTLSLLSVSTYNIVSGKAYLPKWLKLAGQCLTGVIVGLRISREDILNMRLLIVPVIIVLLCSVVFNYICGYLIHKVCKLDLSTSLFSSIPAGAADMALIATDLGGDAPKVSILHLVRYVSILAIMPIIIDLIS